MLSFVSVRVVVRVGQVVVGAGPSADQNEIYPQQTIKDVLSEFLNDADVDDINDLSRLGGGTR
jgi:hypothetical protein